MLQALLNYISIHNIYIHRMNILQLQPDIISQTTTVVKLLSLSQGKCHHTNILKVSHNQIADQQYPEPSINESYIRQQGNTLRKCTQIIYNRGKYNIQDVFTFSGEHQEHRHKPMTSSFISESQSSGNNSVKEKKKQKKGKKKLYMFKKTANRQGPIKRNTKNVPKNFCKAFLAYMEQLPQKPKRKWSKAMKDFRRLQSKNKYNNILIQKILSNDRIVPFFKDFLSNHAEDWISSSKISDKEVHLEAVKIYMTLINSLAYVEPDPNPSDE